MPIANIRNNVPFVNILPFGVKKEKGQILNIKYSKRDLTFLSKKSAI